MRVLCARGGNSRAAKDTQKCACPWRINISKTSESAPWVVGKFCSQHNHVRVDKDGTLFAGSRVTPSRLTREESKCVLEQVMKLEADPTLSLITTECTKQLCARAGAPKV